MMNFRDEDALSATVQRCNCAWIQNAEAHSEHEHSSVATNYISGLHSLQPADASPRNETEARSSSSSNFSLLKIPTRNARQRKYTFYLMTNFPAKSGSFPLPCNEGHGAKCHEYVSRGGGARTKSRRVKLESGNNK